MKIHRKYITAAGLCAVLACFFLSGCGKGNVQADEPPADTSTESVPEVNPQPIVPQTTKTAREQSEDPAEETSAEEKKCYYLEAADESKYIPSFTLFPDGSFSFGYDPLSSYFIAGTYELKHGYLVAATSDGLNRYVFREDGENYQFLQYASSKLTLIDERISSRVTDGAVFVLGEAVEEYQAQMTAVVKEIGEDYLLVTSVTDEYPGAYYVSFEEADTGGLQGGDRIKIFWSGDMPDAIAFPARIHAKGYEALGPAD